MELPAEYMHKLGTSRIFSDFTFKVPNGADHKVHKVILSAHSPVFERFFHQHPHSHEAHLFALFPTLTLDDFTKLAIREAMIDVFAYCYFGRYYPKPQTNDRAAGDGFEIRVLSHFLTLSLAGHLEIEGLVGHAHMHFIAAFVEFDSSATTEQVQAALKKCFSSEFLEDQGLSEQALRILREVAFEGFAELVGKMKREERFREALELMEEVPGAAVKLYSCGSLGKHGEVSGGRDGGGSERGEGDEGEEEEGTVTEVGNEIQDRPAEVV